MQRRRDRAGGAACRISICAKRSRGGRGLPVCDIRGDRSPADRQGSAAGNRAAGKKEEERRGSANAAAERGGRRTLFRSVGCLACHRVGELGSDGLFGGGDLAHVADKRPADFFARWLIDPAAINRDHRMPVFALEAPEVESLALYLQTLGVPARPRPSPGPRSSSGLAAS